MSDNYDQLALSWVRKEINNTLDQARQGLENFSEDTQDQTQIHFCINCLHQVQGTLQMLDFSGAARLALEMENLAEKMANDSQYAVDSAFEVLMRALLQMPGYLERVEEGHKDVPVILLPLLNQIRDASGLPPILERELFSADVSGVLPPQASEKSSEADKTSALQQNIKKLRVHYQKGLMGVIRGENIKESLARIHKVLLRLESLTEGNPVAKLWWIADGFIFAITEKGLYKKKEIHQLLAKVDKHIKRLADEGNIALADVISEELLSELLYYVARSKSKNARVLSLKKEFKLAEALPAKKEIKERQAKLAKPDTTAITNVGEALNEELTLVKEQLDLFVRVKSKDPLQLESLVSSLSRIADTLTLLELSIPRDVIRQQIKSIQAIIDNGSEPQDSIVMDVAGALLFVEANLKNIDLDAKGEGIDEAEATERSQAQAKEAQVDEATQALIKVSRKSMQSAKDIIIGYIAAGFDREVMSSVPELLDEVIGGVKIVNFDLAAEILHTAKSFIQGQILESNEKPKEEFLDALADVITSVEYYLEASEEGKYKGLNSILKGAEDSINKLTLATEGKVSVIDAVQTPLDSVETGAVSSFDTSETDREPLVAMEATELNLAEIETVEPKNTEVESVETSAVEKAPDEFVAAPAAEKVVAPERAVNKTPSAEKEIDETLIDDEVLEIFLEEADEEMQTLSEMMPRWINNLQDQDALTTLRRSFHTLKGSGRLVGAKVIGEVSWAVENMLNRVIEELVPAETPVISVLNEVQLMLPRLVESFAAKQDPSTELGYDQLIAKAEHIAAGKPIAEFSFAQTEPAQPVSEIEASETIHEPLDPVLLEIFSGEAESHLNTIKDYLAAAPADGTVAVTDDLIRALHTLKGSAKMANVEAMAGLTGPWEKYARLVKGSGQRFEQPIVKLLNECYQYLDLTLEQLKNSQPIDTARELVLLDELQSLTQGSDKAGEQAEITSEQRFTTIFLTEGLDILHEVADFNQQLKSDQANESIRDSIKTELHAFYRGSEVVAIAPLVSLAGAAEKLVDFIASEKLELDASFTDLLTEVLENLEAMLSKIASEEDIHACQELIAKIDGWIATAGKESAPEDMDIELVELFVEEGEELIESVRELLVRWKDNLTSKELCGELRRIYHTIKGSSRMAGAMNIGELGYAVEDIFNTVIDFGRELTEKDYQLTLAATDKLELMIAELKTLRWPGEASTHVQQIRQHLSPDSQPSATETAEVELVEPEIAEPELVEPELVEPELVEPELVEPELVEPEIVEPEIVEPELVEPELVEPELVETELVETELVEPESFEPELSEEIVEEAATEDFVTEETDGAEPELIVDTFDELPTEQPEVSTSESIEIVEAGIDEEDEYAQIPVLEDTEIDEIELEPHQPVMLDESTLAEIAREEEEIEASVEQVELEDDLADESPDIPVLEVSEIEDVELALLDERAGLEDISEAAEELAEELETEGLVAEEQEVEELAAEELEAEELAAEELATEELEVEELAAEELEAQELVAEELAAEELEAEELAAEELAAEELAAEELEAEETEAEELVAEETEVEELVAEELEAEVLEAEKPETAQVIHLEIDEDAEEILEIYLEEAEELLITLDEALINWSDNLNDKSAIDLLQRTLHTMKGGARLSDLSVLGNIAHEMETYFERIGSGQIVAKPQDVGVLLEGYDAITNLVDEVKQHSRMTTPTAFISALTQLIKSGKTATQEIEEEPEIPATTEIVETKAATVEETKSADQSSVAQKISEDSIQTIAPSAPIVVTGNVHKVELDEDGEEVLEIYLEEAEELLMTLDEALHDWADNLTNKEAIDLLQRVLHTFKGGARLSDLVVLGNLTHEMETYFERINSGQLEAKSQDIAFLMQGYDVISSLVKEVADQRQMTVPEAYMQSLEKLIGGESVEVVEDSEIDAASLTAAEEVSASKSAEVVSFEEKKQQVEAKQKQSKSVDVIRVPSDQLEVLVNLAGETSIFRSRLEQQMSILRYNLDEMTSTVDRLREQLRNLSIETDAQISYRKEISGEEYEDFDPLEMDRYTRQQELTRGLSESAVDLLSLKEALDAMTSDSETLLLQQGRVNTEMQESLMRTRMIPFESLVPRLRRMVRQISSELNKTIELSISADGEMDRSVLERLIAPLEHMLRNAMDHGIEPEQDRIAANKSKTGRVKISLYRDGSEVFVKIQDDGRGLNLKAIRTKAIERGLIKEQSELSDHELQQLILEAGFSTAQQITQISGRGVGMDVVSSEIKQMGGVIEIDSVEGEGSVFTIKLPFTVSVNHALMVQLGEDVFAIPLANIEGIVRVSPFELEEYYDNADSKFEYAGVNYSMYSLAQLLDHTATPNLRGVTQPLPVLLLHGADHPTALQVDGLLGSREIVVKSIGNQLSSISGLSGATILGDGRVVLILDMPALIRRIDAIVTEETIAEEAQIKATIEEDRSPRIMVVDDSITVRKVTTRLLERHDYEVITAKDGVDALSVLGEHKPDVMLLDIEMPRMDGFELATIIRHDENLKDLPIIMITSRTGDKHRERAEQIGVNQYMGKPFNEVDLIDSISALLPTKV